LKEVFGNEGVKVGSWGRRGKWVVGDDCRLLGRNLTVFLSAKINPMQTAQEIIQ